LNLSPTDLQQDCSFDNPTDGGMKKSESRKKLEETNVAEMFTSLLAR